MRTRTKLHRSRMDTSCKRAADKCASHIQQDVKFGWSWQLRHQQNCLNSSEVETRSAGLGGRDLLARADASKRAGAASSAPSKARRGPDEAAGGGQRLRWAHPSNADSLAIDILTDRNKVRLLRSREIAESRRMKKAYVEKLLTPLLQQLREIEQEAGHGMMIIEKRQEQSFRTRQELIELSQRDFRLHTQVEQLLEANLNLSRQRNLGYQELNSARQAYQRSVNFIREQAYNDSYFSRFYQDAQPSVVDGMVAKHVGNRRRQEASLWGPRGVGSELMQLIMQELIHKVECAEAEAAAGMLEEVRQELALRALPALVNERALRESQDRRDEMSGRSKEEQALKVRVDKLSADLEEASKRFDEAAEEAREMERLEGESASAASQAAKRCGEAKEALTEQGARMAELEEKIESRRRKASLLSKGISEETRLQNEIEVSNKDIEDKLDDLRIDIQTCERANLTATNHVPRGSVLTEAPEAQELATEPAKHGIDDASTEGLDDWKRAAKFDLEKRSLVTSLLADERKLLDVGHNGRYLASQQDRSLNDLIDRSVAVHITSLCPPSPFNLLTFESSSSCFQVANSGRTLIFSPPASPPTPATSHASTKITAFCSPTFTDRRHICRVAVQRLRGKGLLHLGCVHCPAAASPPTRGRAASARHVQLEGSRSWWLSSDGCLMEGEKVLEFAGANVLEGDEIVCSIDLDKRALTFWKAPQQRLGNTSMALDGPVVLAVCVEGEAQVAVTLTGHQVL
eukprot:767597-Hanusia_phi.AAC.4